MLGGAWVRLLARLTLVPLVVLVVLVWLAGFIGRGMESEQVAFMTNLYTDDTGFFQWEVMVLDVNRGIVDRITWSDGDDRFPAWSPDGNRLVFHSNRRAKPMQSMNFYELFAVDPDGRNLDILSEDFLPLPEPEYFGLAGAAMGAWSPDGSRIGFHTGLDGRWNLAVINADGTGFERLTDTLEIDVFFDWSPDGRRIVFSSERDRTLTGGMDLYVMDLDTGETTRITDIEPTYDPQNNPGILNNDSYPAWSPDGTRILFSSTRSGTGDHLFLVNPDGSDLVQITESVAVDDAYPVWIPDGSGALFTSTRNGFSNQLYLVDADGGNLRLLVELPGSSEAPAWRP